MKIQAATLFTFCALLLSSCSTTRAFLHWGPNITDHKIFQHTELSPGDSIFHFKQGNKKIFDEYYFLFSKEGTNDTAKVSIDEYLREKTTTTAFLVIRNDSILFENYYRGYTRTSISKNFSISKSITSLLAGIAVDEKYIESVHDPVTKYIPELKKKDPKFEQLTVEHVLNMRTGFKFNENSYFPFSKATRLYYGTNHLGKVKKAKFKRNPGEVFEYQSLTTALLGVIVERATGKNLSDYLQEKVWTPVGMENRATWDVDDKRHHSNRAHVGVNATAIDLAKIGRLYLNNGNWNGTQIVSANWVKSSTTPIPNNLGYQYQWWSYGDVISKSEDSDSIKTGYIYSPQASFPDSLSAVRFIDQNIPEKKNLTKVRSGKYMNGTLWFLEVYPEESVQYAAEGILHQWIFVDPAKNIIIVRLGEKEDTPSNFLRFLIDRL